MNFKEFENDQKTVYAVIRCWEIVGEAAKNVPEDIRSKQPDVPWRDLAGMRDQCIHRYFGINHRRVWEAVKEDIPKIRPLVQSLLEGMRKIR